MTGEGRAGCLAVAEPMVAHAHFAQVVAAIARHAHQVAHGRLHVVSESAFCLPDREVVAHGEAEVEQAPHQLGDGAAHVARLVIVWQGEADLVACMLDVTGAVGGGFGRPRGERAHAGEVVDEAATQGICHVSNPPVRWLCAFELMLAKATERRQQCGAIRGSRPRRARGRLRAASRASSDRARRPRRCGRAHRRD